MKLTNKQAIEAQAAIGNLSAPELKLPIKTSLEVAKLAWDIERQVSACIRVRDGLIKAYKIKLGIGEKAGTVKYSSLIKGEDDEQSKVLQAVAIAEFSDKLEELMRTEMDDIKVTIHLPKDLVIDAGTLKPLVPFIEIDA